MNMESTQDRVRLFLSKVGHQKVSEATGIKEERCKTIRYDKRAQLRTVELDRIAEQYPEYSLWLRTGETAPDLETMRDEPHPVAGLERVRGVKRWLPAVRRRSDAIPFSDYPAQQLNRNPTPL
ncbi:MAG: hypothetical protein GAK43_01503 [Stenotrophomonas maltophilia]|nr:MAG: hypothetical protein GAK43_01503 [Stenotrophomonas maltophilia]